MIQELLGGTNSSGHIGGDQRKMFSINGGSAGGILEATTVLPHHSSLLSPSPSPSSSTSSAAATAAAASANNSGNSAAAAAAENLRCPRCDSANTKFCYYNNYNLTQPRHFCKTCRRYWTKGGALRNVPIGGGCRKNKSPTASVPSSSSIVSSSSSAAAKSIAGGKMKIIPEPRPGFAIASPAAAAAAFDLSPSSPILWGSPQNSHLLSLLRSAQQNHHHHHHHQNPNPNPNPNSLAVNAASLSVKEEGAVSCIGSHMVMSCSTSGAEPVSLGRSLGLDPVGQAPSLGLCSSFWRSPSSSSSPNNVPSGFTLADHHQISNGNAGIQELYQRLRSSTLSSSSSSSLSGNNNSYYNDQTAAVLTHHHHGHVGSSSSSMESAPVNGGGGEQLGFWNNNNSSAFTWTDLPTTTTNGAYP